MTVVPPLYYIKMSIEDRVLDYAIRGLLKGSRNNTAGVSRYFSGAVGSNGYGRANVMRRSVKRGRSVNAPRTTTAVGSGRAAPLRTRTKRRKKSRMSVRRRSMTGKYYGRFRAKKKSNQTKAKLVREAVRFTVEKGGVETSPDCAYVGHSAGLSNVLRVLSRTLVCALFRKAGYVIQDIEHRPAGIEGGVVPAYNWVIEYQYRNDTLSPLTTSTVNVASTGNFRAISDALEASMLTDITALSTLTEFFTCSLTNSTESRPMSQIYLEHLMVHIGFTSKLNVQNQTLGAGAGDNESTDVTNNPLNGYEYYGEGTGFGLALVNNPVFSVPTLIADVNSGVISFDPNAPNSTTEQVLLMKRPPGVSAMTGCKSRGKIALAPGGIKYSYIKYSRVMSFNNWIKGIYPFLRSTEAKSDLFLSKVLAMEKLCRTGVSVNEISIGYECNQSYMGYCWERIPKMAPTHLVL